MKITTVIRNLLLFISALSISGCGLNDQQNPVDVHTHSFSDYKYNGVAHWKDCECGEKDEYKVHTLKNEITKEATEEETGIERTYCEVCGYSKETTVAKIEHIHSYSGYLYDSNNHWQQCRCGNQEGFKSHTYGSWSVTKAATETETGTKERICTVCGYKETGTVPKINTEDDTYTVADYYNGYYSPIVSWTNGEDLKTQLHTLISKDYVGIVYDANWETNSVTEQSLSDFNKVNVVYSGTDILKTNTFSSSNVTGWQREHAFCASLMTGYNTSEAVNIHGDGTSRATDFHNLFASYGSANSSRSNKNFGYYEPNPEYVSALTNADTSSDSKNFEPNDCDKGRLARAIFYMGVMYNCDESSSISIAYKYKNGEGTSKSLSVTIPAKYKPLQIVEDYQNYSQATLTDFVSGTDQQFAALRETYLTKYKTDTSAFSSTSPTATDLEPYAKAFADYRYNEGNFAIGNLSDLLEWNSFEVDRQEMWHNISVYSYKHTTGNANTGKSQNNRNPFVDYPELVDYVYGSKKDKAGQMNKLKPSAVDLEMDSKDTANYALDSYKATYVAGETITDKDFTLKKVNKDFSIENASLTEPFTPYTFTESDLGQKAITLNTPTGAISYIVNVESAQGINSCNYRFDIEKTSFSSYSITTTPANILTLGGIAYNISAGGACSVAKKETYVQIGNGTSAVPTSFKMESINDFTYGGKTKIAAIYIGINTASGCTYTLKMQAGTAAAKTQSVSYNKNGPQIYEYIPVSATEGKISIELTNVSKALYISCIAVKVI